jgi:hypothetical protein
MTVAAMPVSSPRSLGRELAAVLVIKALALSLIWWVCFSQPAPKATLSAHTESVIVAPAGTAASTREHGHAAH